MTVVGLGNQRRILSIMSAVVVGLLLCAGCGGAIGDLGAAEQARKDLVPKDPGDGGSGPRRQELNRRSSQSCFVIDGAGPELTCAALVGDTDGVAVGGWYWVDVKGDAFRTRPDDSAGSWYWSDPQGRFVAPTGANLSGGDWYWVTDAGAVSSQPTAAAGGWYYLPSPTVVSTTPTTSESVLVTRPGAPDGSGWYWTPPSGSQQPGPVAGGTGPSPVAPPEIPVSDPSPADPSNTSNGSPKTGNGALVGADECPDIQADIDTAAGVNARADCEIFFTWTTTAVIGNVASGQFSIKGHTEPTDPAIRRPSDVSIDVTKAAGSVDVRLTVTNSVGTVVVGNGSVSPAASGACPAGPGVRLTAAIPGFGRTVPVSTITLCDPQLSALLAPG